MSAKAALFERLQRPTWFVAIAGVLTMFGAFAMSLIFFGMGPIRIEGPVLAGAFAFAAGLLFSWRGALLWTPVPALLVLLQRGVGASLSEVSVTALVAGCATLIRVLGFRLAR